MPGFRRSWKSKKVAIEISFPRSAIKWAEITHSVTFALIFVISFPVQLLVLFAAVENRFAATAFERSLYSAETTL